MMTIGSDLTVILPEVGLAVYAMLALVVMVYAGKDKLADMSLYLTAAVFAGGAIYIAMTGAGSNVAFAGSFVDDAFSRFAKVMILLAAAVVLIMGRDFAAKRDMLKFEYPLLLALAVVGMMVMVSAADLMVLYMGLELQSLALYVVASFRRDSARSTEAGLKYFVLGGLSSGLLLFGMSLVYGFAGTTSFTAIMASAQGGVPVGLLMGVVLVISGMAFKVSAAPFHMWTPDVYEGSPTPVTAFFATAPKVAAMALFARVVHDAFGGIIGDWQQVVAVLAVVSMFVGAFAAIGQKDLKRLMAYSSIAHMGFALMGLAAGTAFGVEAMLVYMAIYVSMNIGTFAFLLSMERGGVPVSDIASLHMLSKHRPLAAMCMLLLLFSMAGVPPLLGFFGKFYVLQAAYVAGLEELAILGVISSVIGAFYYLRLVYFMYFGDETDALDSGLPKILTLILVVSAFAMLLGVVNFFGIDGPAAAAAAALVG